MGNKAKTQLSLKQQRFVSALIADPDANGKAAALAAGYSKKHAADAACRLLKNELVSAAVTAARMEIATVGKLDAEAALIRFNQDREFARRVGNANAAVRATEMMARICGLLVERAELKVETVDVGATILEARKRTRLPEVEYEHVTPNPFEKEHDEC